ncbi:MAG: undecaprenyldiphospho-muramoylpentapeptide beta-N-acetylglucosaminyltransferase [Eubacteriaceae bacterium]|nr:undecaprenyldiphospho-muramoylpentapeptide beta-N-acetylglucosaminyltransferase [Eubacteriaceae bacterium]
MKILIACGGTGGHVYPGIAVADELMLRHPDWQIEFVGCSNPKTIENSLIPKTPYPLHTIDVNSFETFYSLLKKLQVATTLFKSLNQSLKIVKKYNPDIVVGTGGYVCGPVVLAGKILRKKTLIAEQNVIPGKTTAVLSSFADKICVSIEESAKHMGHPERCVVTGNPLRHDFKILNREKCRLSYGLSEEQRLVLIFGGSQGAVNINRAAVKLIAENCDRKNLFFHFVTGANNYDDCMTSLGEMGFIPEEHKNVKIEAYCSDMPRVMYAADVCICRSGATTIAEINYIGIPTIFIPLKHAANDHQRKNALASVTRHAALIVEDDEALGDNIDSSLKYLLDNDDLRKTMAENSRKMGVSDSAEKMADEIEKLIISSVAL